VKISGRLVLAMVVLVAATAVGGCSINPATGESTFTGLMSESDEVRRDMMKKLEREKIRLAIQNLRGAGIKSFGFFIFGYPGDTPASIERTARYAREIDPDFANFYPAVPYPGTEMYEKCLRDGMLATDDWSKLEYSYYVLRNDVLNADVVMSAIRRATRQFYLRPSWMARHALDLARIVHSSARLVVHTAARLVWGEQPVSVSGAPVPAPAAAGPVAVHRVEVVRPAPRDDRPAQG